MLYNIKNVSNQFIECTLADESTLMLYPHTEVQIQEHIITPYLKDLASAGIITIEEVKSTETPLADDKKKSPKNDKKEEK